jgi:MFS family permease
MVEYKWVVLSNTTLGTLMAAIDGSIVIISLPAIFRGIQIDPLTSFQYLLWILFGYMIVTASLLVSFGRLSDMHGRVRFYNIGFVIFTVGSILLYLTPNTGDIGALELIFFRIIEAVGAAFLFSNSAALITDAFPPDERGRALGINQVAFQAGTFIGLVVGGVLAAIDWRLVFLVSVPVGVFGTIWSYWKLKEIGTISKGEKIDIWGNLTFTSGLTVILIAITYGLIPYGNSPMGWSNPYVIIGLISGVMLLMAFPFIERATKYPMFKLKLFRIRTFSAGIFATFLSALARGGVMIMLSILLQGIWLPLHGINYADTPLWAGIYLLPLAAGFATIAPISGALSDRYGARGLSTLGMVIALGTFLGLATLPYNFGYLEFAILIYLLGFGMGVFASPNLASIMNSVPEEDRGVAAGMNGTLMNTALPLSMCLFFVVIVFSLSNSLPGAFTVALTKAGASSLIPYFTSVPPTNALFAAFLGYNPVGSVLSHMPYSITSTINSQAVNTLTGLEWFPNTIAKVFMSSLEKAFYIGAVFSGIAAVASLLRGRKYIHEATRDQSST